MLMIMLAITLGAEPDGKDVGMLHFEKERIGDVRYEAASAFDVNNNGTMDIVSGEYWFEGPDFKTAHKITTIEPHGDYFDCFSSFPMDVNGNGYLDIISGAWFGQVLRWYENPKGQPIEWTVHEIAHTGNIERPMFYDIDGDGYPEVIPNCPGEPVRIFKLVRDEQGRGTGEFEQYTISEGPSGHGMGFGDINGNGRVDIILAEGWLEAPEDPYSGLWTFHQEFSLGSASCPVLVHDINGNGHNDLIVGQSHDYGLDWWEQQVDENGNRTWVKHAIDPDRSQYHDMQLADIDNDGELELITGKRYFAHSGNDPGAFDPVGVYYFKINGGEFERVTIDYGPPETASGVGIYFWLADTNNNGFMDVIAPGKEGVYLFRNMGPKQ